MPKPAARAVTARAAPIRRAAACRQGADRLRCEFAATLASMRGGKGAADPARCNAISSSTGASTAGTATHYAVLHSPAEATTVSRTGFCRRDALSFPRRSSVSRMPSLSTSATSLADARFRIFIFAGRAIRPSQAPPCIDRIAIFSASDPTCLCENTRQGGYRRGHRCARSRPAGASRTCRGALPALLLPKKGRYGLRDYEKMFCADSRSDLGMFVQHIDPVGCVIVVQRPDR